MPSFSRGTSGGDFANVGDAPRREISPDLSRD